MNLRDLFTPRRGKQDTALLEDAKRVARMLEYEQQRPKAPQPRYAHVSTLEVLSFKEDNDQLYVAVRATVLRDGESQMYEIALMPGDVLRFYGNVVQEYA